MDLRVIGGIAGAWGQSALLDQLVQMEIQDHQASRE